MAELNALYFTIVVLQAELPEVAFTVDYKNLTTLYIYSDHVTYNQRLSRQQEDFFHQVLG